MAKTKKLKRPPRDIEEIKSVINRTRKITLEAGNGGKDSLTPEEVFCLQELVNAGHFFVNT